MSRLLTVLAFLLLAGCGANFSETAVPNREPDPEELLTRVRSVLDQTRSIEYDFQYRGSGTMAGDYRGTMKIRTSRAGRPSIRARIEDWSSASQQPDAILQIVSDGHTVSMADEVGRTYQSAGLDRGASQILVNAYWGVIIEFITSKPLHTQGKSTLQYLGTEPVNGVDCDVLRQVIPVPGGTTTIDWTIGAKDSLPRRQTWRNEIAESPGEMTLDLYDMVVDSFLEDEEFILERPPAFQELAWAGPDIEPGAAAPSFSLPTPAGETVTLEQFRGQHVLLSFWASWCPKCRQLKTELEEIASEHPDGLAVVGINVWEFSQSAREQYLAQQRHGYPVLLEGDAVASSYRLAMLPGIFLIGPDGSFLQVDNGVGWQDLGALRHQIRSALSKP